MTTSFAAADLIRHLRDEGSGGVIKSITSALAKAFGIPKDVSNLLCEIGVSRGCQPDGSAKGRKGFFGEAKGGQQLQG